MGKCTFSEAFVNGSEKKLWEYVENIPPASKFITVTYSFLVTYLSVDNQFPWSIYQPLVLKMFANSSVIKLYSATNLQMM